jgi:hypothetical protein
VTKALGKISFRLPRLDFQGFRELVASFAKTNLNPTPVSRDFETCKRETKLLGV